MDWAVDIEDALGDPLFMGVPIGSTLTDLLGTWMRGGLPQRTIKHHIRQRASALLKSRGAGWKWGGKGWEKGLTGAPLLTWITPERRCAELVLPVARRLQRCSVIGTAAEMEASLPETAHFIHWPSVGPSSEGTWRRAYRRHSPEWHRLIDEVLTRHRIPRHVRWTLRHQLVVQSRRIAASTALLDRLNPTVVVADYDRNTRASCLVLAARARGIPTMTMMHGVINSPHGYTPLLSDAALCWGELHRDQLEELGTDRGRLIVVGCQRLERGLRSDRQSALTKIEGLDGRPVVLLATSPIAMPDRKAFVRVFCEAMREQPDYQAVIRLHPSEHIDVYAEEMREYPSVAFLPNTAWTLDEALAASRLVVAHDSGFGYDALVKEVPVIVLDVLERPLGAGRVIMERAVMPVARSSGELAEIVADVVPEGAARQELVARAKDFADYYSAAFGDGAAGNIVSVINGCCGSRGGAGAWSDSYSQPLS